MNYSSLEGRYNKYAKSTPTEIGPKMRTTNNLKTILDSYYKLYLNNKLKLYTTHIDNSQRECLKNNQQLNELFNILTKKRTITNRLTFRKNNTLDNLINFYNIILDMLSKYTISNNNLCFYMIINIYIQVSRLQHLTNYLKDPILLDLIIEIRTYIMSNVYRFLDNIYLSYLENYNKQNYNKQNYEYLIELYIKFLVLYNFISNFPRNNITNDLLQNLRILYNDINQKNKILFEKYIIYLGKFELKNLVTTGFINPEINELVKGLYYQGRI
jgi:hypothetical protein